MRSITWRNTGAYVLIVLPVLGLAGIVAIGRQQDTPQGASQQGQQGGVDPVVAAARKAREQKKSEPKPKKVYTNDDLGGGTTPPAPAAPTSTAPAGVSKAQAAQSAEAAATDGKSPEADKDKNGAPNQNTEEAWRKRFREARAQLAQAEQELDILQRESQKAQVQYYNDPQKALSEQYSRKEVTDKDTKIAAKKQEIAQMKQHISDMEDDLRKSGGDSGWAR
jgi:hypothetical protein